MRTLGGLLLIFGAAMVAFLWERGYLSAAIGQAVGYVQNPPALRPIGSSSGGGGPRVS